MEKHQAVTELAAGACLGRPVDRRTFGGIDIIQTAYSTGSVLPPHTHPNATFFFAVRGGFHDWWQGGAREIARGTAGYYPAELKHGVQVAGPSSGARGLHIELPAGWLSERDPQLRLGDAPLHLTSAPLRFLFARLHRELLVGDVVSRLAVEGLLIEIVATVLRLETPLGGCAPGWMLRALDLFRADLASPPSLREVAVALSVPPSDLVRAMRAHLGCGPAEYLRRTRIEWTRNQLITTSTPLAQIAVAAGFCDQSHFSRVFTRHVGIPPGRFRRMNRAA